jgi:circadian clock protein KaiB
MSRRTLFRFRLYVVKDTQNSVQAFANLTAICRAHLPNRYEIEVVDLFKEPTRALADDVLMTPTLIVLSAHPVRRIVGTLSDAEPLLQLLGLGIVAA